MTQSRNEGVAEKFKSFLKLQLCLGSTVKDTHGPDRICSEGGHENDQNTFPLKRGYKSGSVQPGEEKDPERPYCGLSVYKGNLLERWRDVPCFFSPGLLC